MPGKKPASAAPSRVRTSRNFASVSAHAIAADSTPHSSVVQPIHFLAPNLRISRLAGTPRKA
ncbi:Uncharacterised protein [Klebsiella quasipneumoniae]|nr:Uncharacterised protein [Klebsiella quasipneumoniae]VGQ05956.1 hypothetical protein SB00610_05176 [Klebsiella quasipneumoniae subsp. similipneumoniae]